MQTIHTSTIIHAPIGRVFDLARSIDAHQYSTKSTNERAVGGRLSGLIEEGETVTWEAKHFFVTQRLTVQITKLERPNEFRDVMLKGAFKSMKHTHRFIEVGEHTRMSDRFEFSAPLGFLGIIAEHLFLKSYMRRFLEKRAAILKEVAETERWRDFLESS